MHAIQYITIQAMILSALEKPICSYQKKISNYEILIKKVSRSYDIIRRKRDIQVKLEKYTNQLK